MQKIQDTNIGVKNAMIKIIINNNKRKYKSSYTIIVYINKTIKHDGKKYKYELLNVKTPQTFKECLEWIKDENYSEDGTPYHIELTRSNKEINQEESNE